jgi:hemerythrin superfamily protein
MRRSVGVAAPAGKCGNFPLRGNEPDEPRFFKNEIFTVRERAMEFLQWLEKEHQTVRQLLQKVAQADGAMRERLFRQVKQELEVHHRLEEKYLYPLGEGWRPTKGMADHAIEETQKTERMMAQMDPADPGFDAQLQEFTQMIEDHVEEEEHELVPQLMREVPRDQQRKLVRILQQAKKMEMAAA